MHILTKIFVVLVALLAVATVPFVIVQGANEATFRTQSNENKDAAEAARTDLNAARTAAARVEADLQAQVAQAEANRANIEADLATTAMELSQAAQDAERLRAQIAQLEATGAVLAETERAQHAMIEALHGEIGSLRDRAVGAEQQLVEIQTALDVKSSDFEAAISAQMVLQEELERQRMESEKALASALAGAASASPEDEPVGVEPNKDVEARITQLFRTAAGKTIVQIDQGSRAGVAVGWVMGISEGNTYVGDLLIKSVNANDAVGEFVGQPTDGNSVEVGQRVISRLSN